MDSSSLKPSLEKQLKGHQGGITALFYNPNDTQIASSSLDHSVLVNFNNNLFNIGFRPFAF